MSRRRRLSIALAVLILAAGLVVTIGYFWLQRSVQPRDGTATLAGLEAEVGVGFDAWGIPTIRAETVLDAIRAQGFVHASDRLWQLHLFQRIARGRLAEAFGEAAIETDRLIRTLDLWGAAGRVLDALPPADRRMLEAYAEGVNARIASWRGPWPPEFLLLGLEPEPWSPRASLAIARIMALDLSGWRDELARHGTLTRLRAELRDVLEPAYPAWGPTILQDAELADVTDPGGGSVPADSTSAPDVAAVGRGSPYAAIGRAAGAGRAAAGGPGGEPVGPRGKPAGFRGKPVGPRARDERDAGWDRPETAEGSWDPIRFLSSFALHGSNSWAVGGSRTADGHPLLANDMHLSLRAPSTWYINGLHAEGFDVVGFSIPGAPGVIVGLNGHLAWGFTNAMLDDGDFIAESENLDGSMYVVDGEWTPFEVQEDTIPVRGADPVTVRIRRTVRGPVITDVIPATGLTLSLRWTGLEPLTAAPAILEMNRARSADAFRAALAAFRSPHQNVIYATVGGELGYRMIGAIPDRPLQAGAAPRSFDEEPHGWSGYLSLDSMPALRGPASDFLASANNLQGTAYFGVVGVDYPLPFRARRIVDRVSAASGWTVDDMRELQLDVRSLWADRWLHRAVAAAGRAGMPGIAASLRDWDRSVDLESTGATLFYVWLYRLRELIAADELDVDGWFPDLALDRILVAGDHVWVDDVDTPERERLEALEEAAIRTAAEEAAGRAWGEVHMERSVHPLASVGWIDRIFRFAVGPYPAPGGRDTVRPDEPFRWHVLDASSWSLPILSEYGPSERFVADLDPDGPLGHFLLPTGQSGNPLDPHYRDMSRVWREARLIPVSPDPERQRERERSRLTLTP